MSAERAEGRGWVRIPASRAEQPGTTRAAPPHPYARSPYDQDAYADSYPHAGYPRAGHPHAQSAQDPYPQGQYAQEPYAQDPYAQEPYAQASYEPSMIYLSLVKRWQEAGRTLPGHPDEEWERLISQPCWPGR